MRRLVIALIVGTAAGCPKGSKSTTPGSGSGSGSGAGSAVYGKEMVVSWGIASPVGGTTDVFLQTTDETGAQKSHATGSYPGTCAIFAPAAEMKAMSGVRCVLEDGKSGTELHAVKGNGEVIVVRGQFSDG